MFIILPSGAYVTFHMRGCSHYEIRENKLNGDYVTIVHPAFCLYLYLTGVHFRGELQHGGEINQQKISVDQSELKK